MYVELAVQCTTSSPQFINIR